MHVSSFFKRMNNTAQEVKALGPLVLMRHFRKATSTKGDVDQVAKISTRVGPIFLRLHDSDNIVMNKIFVDLEYDLDKLPQGRSIRNEYERIIARNKTPIIIDAGANIGLAARFFAQAYPAANIIAVEPDPANLKMCRRNVDGFPNIEVVEAAIGSKSGYVSVIPEDNESWSTRTVRAEKGLPIVTIRDLVSKHPNGEILIVKVDIEGFERDLFASDTEWLENVTAVVIEPHDWLFPGEGSSRHLQQVMMKGDRELLILGENIAWIKSRPDASD